MREMRFVRLEHPGQKPGTVVVVAEDEQASMLLRWVPDTGLWHRAGDLEADYLFGDEGGVYTPISAEQAARLLRQVRKFDTRRSDGRRALAALRALPETQKRTNAEMGLSGGQTRMRPTTAAGLGKLLEQGSSRGRWRAVNVYGAESADSAPRQLASSINAGRGIKLASGQRAEARVKREDDRVLVQARLARGAGSA